MKAKSLHGSKHFQEDESTKQNHPQGWRDGSVMKSHLAGLSVILERTPKFGSQHPPQADPSYLQFQLWGTLTPSFGIYKVPTYSLICKHIL